MTWALFVDSSNSISFDPEFDYSDPKQKIESGHRTKSGAYYRYKWGSYSQFKFSLKYVSSSNAAIINSWWVSNTKLLFMDENTTDVTSVIIMNKSTPLDERIMPYKEYFQGKIELGTY